MLCAHSESNLTLSFKMEQVWTLEKTSTPVPIQTGMKIFTVVLFVISKTWKPPEYPS